MGKLEERLVKLSLLGGGGYALYRLLQRFLTGEVLVTVKDALTLNPVAGAVVFCDSLHSTTDEQGKTTFRVPFGTRTVSAVAEGYLEARDSVYVPIMGRVEVTLEIGPPTPPETIDSLVNVEILATALQDFGNDNLLGENASGGDTEIRSQWLPMNYLLPLTRAWLDEGKSPVYRYRTDGEWRVEETAAWPQVPYLMCKYNPTKLPLENLKVVLENPAFRKSSATLADGTARIFRVPSGDYTLRALYGGEELEYTLDGQTGAAQTVSIDPEHRRFQIYLPQREKFPPRRAVYDYFGRTGDYLLGLMEIPMQGRPNWLVVAHPADPTRITEEEGMPTLLEVWEADDPEATSPGDPRVKLRYEVHKVTPYVSGEDLYARCSCGKDLGFVYGPDSLWSVFVHLRAVEHFAEMVRGKYGTRRTGLVVYCPYTNQMVYGYNHFGITPSTWATLSVAGEARFLFVKFAKSPPGYESLLRAEISRDGRVTYHAWFDLDERKLNMACGSCTWTSSLAIPSPVGTDDVLRAKYRLWQSFLSHMEQDHPGVEHEDWTRLKQVLVW